MRLHADFTSSNNIARGRSCPASPAPRYAFTQTSTPLYTTHLRSAVVCTFRASRYVNPAARREDGGGGGRKARGGRLTAQALPAASLATHAATRQPTQEKTSQQTNARTCTPIRRDNLLSRSTRHREMCAVLTSSESSSSDFAIRSK